MITKINKLIIYLIICLFKGTAEESSMFISK